ncbi:transmembrane protein 18-domain-containing protein [Cunninghamella echinulata]|nr:transmembrane protein 18-domain-containing protein [Cunninghamella echinulata]
MTISKEDLVKNILSKLPQSESKVSSLIQEQIYQTIEFFQAIDWSQTWLIGLVIFHIVCFLLVIILRNKHTILSYYFFILLGLAALTQPLNQYGGNHWQSFASANYFDESGIFIVSLYAFPLILNGFFTLMFILKASFGLMIEMKRRQLMNKAKLTPDKKSNNNNNKTKND